MDTPSHVTSGDTSTRVGVILNLKAVTGPALPVPCPIKGWPLAVHCLRVECAAFFCRPH